MRDDMHLQEGWKVHHPVHLHDLPTDPRQLVCQVSVYGNFEVHDLYPTEAEAWEVARKYLIQQKERAIKELAMLNRGYTSPDGITYHCPQHLVDTWKANAAKSLEIAEAGLAFCDK